MNFGKDNETTGHSSVCECGACICAENASYADEGDKVETDYEATALGLYIQCTECTYTRNGRQCKQTLNEQGLVQAVGGCGLVNKG